MWNNVWHRRARRTTLISVGSGAFLAGLGLSKLGWSAPFGVALAGGLMLLIWGHRRLLLAIVAVVGVGLLMGLWRGESLMHQVAAYDRLVGQRVTLSGEVAQDSTYNDKAQIDFMLGQVRVDGQGLPGQVRVTSFSPVEPKQGDRVVVAAKAAPGFGGYQLGMYYATVEVSHAGNSWEEWLRRHFSAAILNVLPEPQASLGLGFLLGIKSQLPDSLNAQLKLVGLTHIVVASGYNLTVLVRAARRLLARRSKYQATVAAIVMMIGFIGVTGLSPSMCRAGLVTSLSLAAWYYGRTIHPVMLLLLSAAITAGVNPLYIWGDVSWYLSFMAFGGVMLLAPLVQKRLFGRQGVPVAAQVLTETVCAELMTLPLTLFVFGNFSVVAILSNIVVTPLVSLAMLATLAGGLAGLVWPGPGTWAALPAQWILMYMTSVISWLAGIPWARQSMGLSAFGLVLIYGCMGTIGVFMWRRTGHDYLSKSIVE